MWIPYNNYKVNRQITFTTLVWFIKRMTAALVNVNNRTNERKNIILSYNAISNTYIIYSIQFKCQIFCNFRILL